MPPTGRRPAGNEPPVKGAVCYYKKVGSTRVRDIVVLVKGCNHRKWQPTTGADKARKGIAHYEGRTDMKVMHHCGTCTGGGMWRVKWG